jgi:hypothetical protein
MLSNWSDLLFDDAGEPLPADAAFLRHAGLGSIGESLLDAAVRVLGFVRLTPLKSAFLVTFAPATVCDLAAFAAFYHIAQFTPCRVVLAALTMDRADSKYELYPTARDALKRVEAILAASGRSPPAPEDRIHQETMEQRLAMRMGRLVSFRRRDGLALRFDQRDFSTRIRRPLTAISAADAWMAAELANWEGARRRFLLPAIDDVAFCRGMSPVGGRAHVVDTSQAEPTGYWFRHWGPINSYHFGETGRRLGQMPPSLMRDNAIEDYWSTVQAQIPTYHLIRLSAGGATYSYARLLLPFASNGRQVDHLLVLIGERDLSAELPAA